jgi:7-cyano-7-deazaguanine synthase
MKAVILLSGGIDSSVILAMALEQDRACHAISFDYGQKHKIELQSASAIAKHYGIPHQIVRINQFSFGSSALSPEGCVSTNRTESEIASKGIPTTYVPARNTLFLAYATGIAEVNGASEIWTGPNAMDHIYPDCRKEFLDAFQSVLNTATKQAAEGRAPRLITPLLELNKKQIVMEARRLAVPLHITWSCYNPQPNAQPCLICDACILRQAALSNCCTST